MAADGPPWLRVGGALACGALAIVVARRLGITGERGDAERWCSCEASALEHVRTGPRGGGAGTHTALSHTLLSESCNAAHRGYRESDVDEVIQEMIAAGLLGLDAHPVSLCYDMDALRETLLAMKCAFPPHFLHAIAIKSNPLPFFLKCAVDLGFGLECASIAEVVHALRQGCSPDKVMFDSPAKSKREIAFALRHGVQLNADNFDELDRIAQAHANLQAQGIQSRSHVGVRVNPLEGLGKIKALSVSDLRSKFGIPLDETNRPLILERFREHAWLDAVHIHVGSQGCTMQQHASGADKLVRLVEDIEGAVGAGRVRVVDIGGGLPVNFESDSVRPQYAEYARILEQVAPGLFTNPQRRVVTEYGRSASAKAAFAVCAVEYVKESGDGLDIAVIQAGADLFMRTCYVPENFPLRISAHHWSDGKRLSCADECESAGTVSKGRSTSHAHGDGVNGSRNWGNGNDRRHGHVRASAQVTIAGPLCFGGDKVACEVKLPQLTEGDFVVVHDAGANTLSTFSRHCSRTAPPVFGYYRERIGEGQKGAVLKVVLLKAAETVEQVLSFWGGA